MTFITRDSRDCRMVPGKIFSSLTLLLFPRVIGINLVADRFIIVFAGDSFIESFQSLRILSLALVFSTYPSFYSTSVLLPFKGEKNILKATILSAVINVLLNYIFIPLFSQNGAALTTLIAELVVFLMLLLMGGKMFISMGFIKL